MLPKGATGMATYVIGDVQGCFLTLQALLKKINFDSSKDKLIFLGDIINRGSHSLEMLRFLFQHQDCMTTVLGNHEIFALALYLGAIKESRPHTLSALFLAPDGAELMEWLRHRPLIVQKEEHIFVHAGILPAVRMDDALLFAKLVEEKIRGPEAGQFLTKFYQKRAFNLKLCDSKKKLMRLTLSYLTLMRMCDTKFTLNLGYTGGLSKAPKDLKPWFKLRDNEPYKIYFGHWAALGFYVYKNYMCLDSGCVWGNQLSAWHMEEKRLIQVANAEPKL